MSTGARRVLVWAGWSLSLLLAIASLVLLVIGRELTPPSEVWGFRGFSAVFAVLFGTVGALISWRRPDNPIGWLYLFAGVGSGVQEVASQYAILALIDRPVALPWGDIAAWYVDWAWIVITGAAGPMVFLLFPHGRFGSKAWRRLAIALAVAIGASCLALMLAPGRLENFPVENPLGVQGAAWLEALTGGLAVYMLAFVVSVVRLFVRLRHATGVERQQLKWFAFSASLVALALGSSLAYFPGSTDGNTVPYLVEVGVVLAFMAMPIAIGVAILRHGLFDIDVLINRTLVYGSLTALLGGVYVGLVVGLGAIVRSMTPRGNDTLVVATSTLLVAALVRPARTTLQRVIDRRFYRSRYDAERALERFAAGLRDHVELTSLKSDLVAVLEDTVHPASASVWLASAPVTLPERPSGNKETAWRRS